jgi:hypothetical protein
MNTKNFANKKGMNIKEILFKGKKSDGLIFITD